MSIKISFGGLEPAELAGEWEETEPGAFHFHPHYGNMLGINGCSFHIEAIEVEDDDQGTQQPVHSHNEDILDGLWRVDNVSFETVEIEGRTCVMYVIPAER